VGLKLDNANPETAQPSRDGWAVSTWASTDDYDDFTSGLYVSKRYNHGGQWFFVCIDHINGLRWRNCRHDDRSDARIVERISCSVWIAAATSRWGWTVRRYTKGSWCLLTLDLVYHIGLLDKIDQTLFLDRTPICDIICINFSSHDKHLVWSSHHIAHRRQILFVCGRIVYPVKAYILCMCTMVQLYSLFGWDQVKIVSEAGLWYFVLLVRREPCCNTAISVSLAILITNQTDKIQKKKFSVSGPLLWNSLPLTVRDVSLTLTQFYTRLKTFLFCR